MEMHVEIRFKNVAFLTSRMFASAMIRVLSKFEHSAGHVRIPETICRTFVCVPLLAPLNKHNRAKPMSESASALFSIADAGEFRFARFYIVREEVPLGDTRKSAHCLRCAGHAPVGLSKHGRDTESDANIQPEEMLTFSLQRISIYIST